MAWTPHTFCLRMDSLLQYLIDQKPCIGILLELRIKYQQRVEGEGDGWVGGDVRT